MDRDAVDDSRGRAGWLTRRLRSVGAVAGLVGAGAGIATPSASSQGGGYRSAAAAPAAWQEFAKQLQAKLGLRFAGDDDRVRQFRDYMARRATPGAPPTLVVRAWILPGGNIRRLEFDGLDDDDVAGNLRALLAEGDVGAPPPDMLQPVHVRLSLRPDDPSGRER